MGMHKNFRRRFAAVLSTMGLLIGGMFALGASPASAADYSFSCSIGAGGWYDCASDNYTVAPGKKVYIALKTSGGKGVWFRVKNRSGDHLLSSPGVKQSPNGSFYFYWTNNTSGNIVIDIDIDIETDASAIVSVYATTTLRII